jgi:chromosomal replication initiator protein
VSLGDTSSGESAAQLTIQNIIDAVTTFYGVKLSDLQSKRRHRSITVPRQVCMFLARRRTRYSLEEIGGYFGGRDHTTVMHADRKIRQQMAERRSLFNQIAELTNRIKQTT